MNYWLSVFFTWLPALIFYLIEKDKGDPRARYLHAANLNFAILRAGALFVWYIIAIPLAFIPYLGLIIVGIGYLAIGVGPLVLHIIAATKIKENYMTGNPKPFMFNVTWVK
jgi:uncharacterized membrane protein